MALQFICHELDSVFGSFILLCSIILDEMLEIYNSRHLAACLWGFFRTHEALWYPEPETQAWETGHSVENHFPVSAALPAVSAFPLSPTLVWLSVCSDMAGARTHELACFSKRIVLIWNWQRSRKYFPNWGWLMECVWGGLRTKQKVEKGTRTRRDKEV